MKKAIYIISGFFLILIFSCEGIDDKPSIDIVEGELTGFTTCKSFKNSYSTDSIAVNQSCVEYTYLNEVLHITHVNAGFNCCPGVLSAGFNIDINTITISEFEEEALCNCNCLYDLEIEISGLSQDTYHFIFNEPYWNYPNNELVFSINLNDSTSGSFCVTRNIYPWGIY